MSNTEESDPSKLRSVSSSSSATSSKRRSSCSEESDEPKTKLERHVSIGNGIFVQHDVLFRTLECPVCLEVPEPPITLCKAGHLVCGRCQKNLTVCGICRAKLTGTRNFAIEALIDGLKVECKYNMCKSRIKLAELSGHTEVCEYRSIICNHTVLKNCAKASVEWEDYADHLKQVHGGVTSATLVGGWSSLWQCKLWRGGVENLSDMETDPAKPCTISIFESEGVAFLMYVRREYAHVYVWITAMLTEAEAAKFGAELYVVKDKAKASNGQYHVKWNMDISTVHKSLEDLKYTKYCAVFPVRSLLAFSTQDDQEVWNTYFQMKISRI